MIKKNPFVMLMSFILLMLVVSQSCNFPGLDFQDSPFPTDDPEILTLAAVSTEMESLSAEATPTQFKVASVGNIYPPSFGKYPDIEAKVPEAYTGGYSLPLDLGQVQMSIDLTLSDAQRALLSQNGFVVESPNPEMQFNEFYQVYESIRYWEAQPAFITTDSVFHVYHLLFDKMLRDLEIVYFIPALEELTSALLVESSSQLSALSGSPLEGAALRNAAYFGVAVRLLGLNDAIPPPAESLVQSELALIEAASGPKESPIWFDEALPEDERLIEDYSQYIPRGHYTRSEALERYFKAMMWYGRMTMRLDNDMETRRALLATQALRTVSGSSGASAEDLWQTIYDPTTFIVGKSDDLSFYEYGGIADAVYGAAPSLQDYASDDLLAQFRLAAETLPPPQVNSMWVWIWQDQETVTKGFRFMGQQFTLDQYVFGQVMWRNVGTIDAPRDLPVALDFFAALGSEEARNILLEMGEDQYAHYTTQLDKVTNQVATLEQDSWTQNLYWTWLYSFDPVIEPKNQSYPPFMRNQAWTRKELNTALSSWTELKHDTILYAKQVMAEMGGGGMDDPPHGWVEPNPAVYARLLGLTRMTLEGLQSRNLTPEVTFGAFQQLEQLLAFCQYAAEAELTGQLLSEDDYWTIQFYGGQLESLTIAAADLEGEGYSPILEDQKAALVADVATGMGRVREEATGHPVRIFVVLPDEPYRVAIGAVFSYYEFEVEPGERLTDEAWQALLESGQAPPQPAWTSSFSAP